MDAYIIGGYRSPVGRSGKGVFRFMRPDDLGEQVIRKLMSDFPQLDKERIDDVIVGNATPEAEQGLNIGRMVSLMGLDTEKVPGMTVNRYCASGLESIAIASAKIHAGMSDCIIAGGIETMSPIPFGGWRLVPNAKVAKNNPEWYWGMGLTAEAVANDYNISREDQDAFAYRSHMKATAARDEGRLSEEIVPVKIPRRKQDDLIFEHDEFIKSGTTKEILAKLRPAFKKEGGSVTAGNASGLNDGAAALLFANEKGLKAQGLKPLAEIVSSAVVGVEPRIMGIGPVKASEIALERAGIGFDNLDVIELNEAFSAQALSCIRAWGLADDDARINPNGGGISLGHPLGMTGSRILLSAANHLKRTGGTYGLVTLCIGVGQGFAVVIKNATNANISL